MECKFPDWAALTQPQRACFMDDAGNIVAATELLEYKNRLVTNLLKTFFNEEVPPKDPCPNSVPDDTPENRKAAWVKLCQSESKDKYRKTLEDEIIIYFSDKRIRWKSFLVNSSYTETPSNSRLKYFINTFNIGINRSNLYFVNFLKLY